MSGERLLQKRKARLNRHRILNHCRKKGIIQCKGDSAVYLSPQRNLEVPFSATEPSKFEGQPMESGVLPEGRRPKTNNLSQVLVNNRNIKKKTLTQVIQKYKNTGNNGNTTKTLKKFNDKIPHYDKYYDVSVFPLNAFKNVSKTNKKIDNIIVGLYKTANKKYSNDVIVTKIASLIALNICELDKWKARVYDVLGIPQLSRIIQKTAARQDMSKNALERLLEEGYTTVVFEAHPLACELCKDMDQETWELADFLSNLEHDAPIFEHTHVNALSAIRVSGEGLPDILLDYTGIIRKGNLNKISKKMKLEMFYDNTKKCWHLYINGDSKATCYLPITVIEWLNLSHYKYDLSELTRVLENSKMQSGKVHPINIEASYLPHEGIIEVNNTMDIHFDTMHENVPYVDIWQFYAEPAQDMFQHREDALKGDMNRMYQKCPYCGKKLTSHTLIKFNNQWYHKPCKDKGPISF